jgi:stage V sporulation protein D (sporulation-specific penicillin-binding protein)
VGRPWKAPAPSAWGPPGRRPRESRSGVPRNFARVGQFRAKLLFYLFVLLALGLVARLYVVQIRDGPLLAARARSQSMETIHQPALRGTIFDRDGNALARSLPGDSVYASTSEVVDKPATAARLAQVLGLREPGILADLQLPGNVAIYRKAPHEPVERLRKMGLAGISIEREATGLRFVPSGTLASTILGFTGIDENGLEGIENGYDSYLSGRPGELKRESDQFGRALPFASQRVVEQARAGFSLALTLDSYLQDKAERVLRATVAKYHAASGTIVIMDPHTGELLAVANAPDYDVNRYSSATPERRRDRAASDVYEPGSTFKLITAAAALDSGKVTVADRFPARDRLEIGGHVIHNAEDGFLAGSASSETLEDIVAYSHNVGAAEVALAMGARTMSDALHRFGFDQETHSGLPGESAGIVTPLDQWSATSLPTIAFGHGIAVTPIALVRAYASIANDGVMLRPRILSSVLSPDGRTLYAYGPEVERRVMSRETAATLRKILRAVVVRGTGNPTAQVAGYTTAGKTGTAQVAENGRYVPGEYVASFIGMVPAEAARFVILVKIERPRGAIYGGEVAAPAFAQLAQLAMLHAGVPPSLPSAAPAAAAARLVKPAHASKQHP